jgi:hypothetical protein
MWGTATGSRTPVTRGWWDRRPATVFRIAGRSLTSLGETRAAASGSVAVCSGLPHCHHALPRSVCGGSAQPVRRHM